MSYRRTLGRNLNVKQGGVTMALAKSCTLDIKMSFTESANPTFGGWKKFVPHSIEWGVSCSGLYSAMGAELLSKMRSREAVDVEFTDNENMLTYVGQAWIESIQQTGTIKEIATYTVKFKGNGPLVNKPITS